MSEQKTIYVVFKTHFDIGFTELAKEVIERYGEKMLPDVIKTCEGSQVLGKEQQYVWTMAAWPLIQSLNPDTAATEDIKKAKELINSGQIAWHLLPFTTHTEFCGLEEYIRGMYFSRQLSEEYGIWPISAKMTDVPGHTWILPSLLYKAGIKFLHLGCNPGCMPPDVPRLFYWEGPDGNRVLTFYSKGYYGSSLIPPEDWPFPVWLALMQTNDNMGPQGSEVIEEILTDVREELPNAKVVVGRMDDFYRALQRYPLDDVPVIRQDLADTWIHGVGTYPGEVSCLREYRHKLADTEKALSLCKMAGLLDENEVNRYSEKIKKAYEQGLLFGEHTWGLDVKTSMGHHRRYKKQEFLKDKTTPSYGRMEESWDEQRQRVSCVRDVVEVVSSAVLDKLAGSVDIDGARWIVFNGLGWKRDALVELEEYKDYIKQGQLIDSESRLPLDTMIVQGRFMAFVRNLPALGYKTITLKERVSEDSMKDKVMGDSIMRTLVCDPDAGILENSWYRIEVDKCRGGIKSLVDKSTGKEWVDGTKGYGFGQYQYDIYGIDEITEFIRTYAYRFHDWLVNDLGRLSYPPQKHLRFIPENFSSRVATDQGAASLIMTCSIHGESVEEYGNASKIEMCITIYARQPYLDIMFKLDSKQETPFIEAGHFIFPVNLKNPQIRINKLGSVVNPECDIVKDANHLLYCCENWVDISDGENGIAFIPLDTPLFSIGGESIYKYRREYEKSDPILFFNAYNNSWGTNFPQWMGGDYIFRYRLIPHKGDWREWDIAKLALESVTPPLIGYSAAKSNDKVKIHMLSGLIKEMDGMEVLALKLSEDRLGFVLRLREIKGEGRIVELNFTENVRKISKCDLLERIEEDLNADSNSISFNTSPFEVHTFYMNI